MSESRSRICTTTTALVDESFFYYGLWKNKPLLLAPINQTTMLSLVMGREVIESNGW
jgi:hypothetical protein